MVPVKGIKLDIPSALLPLILILQITLLIFTLINYDFSVRSIQEFKSSTVKSNTVYLKSEGTLPKLNDFYEIRNYKNYLSDQKKAMLKIDEENKNYKNKKLQLLAERYQADPKYLDFIVKVEKTFKLEPCELLALIAQESGFKPQTRMDGGSLSYSTTQMKLATAQTAYMAITEYYKMNIVPPTHELLQNNQYYATFLAGGYLRYLYDVYKNKEEAYTAYNWGIGGRMVFYQKNGHFRSAYALKLSNLRDEFRHFVGKDYALIGNSDV